MSNFDTINHLNGFLKFISPSQQALLESVRAVQTALTNSLTASQDSAKIICDSIISIIDSISETSILSYQSVCEALLDTFESFSETTRLVNTEVYNVLNTLSENLSISEDEISVSDSALQSVSKVIDLPIESINQESNSSSNLMSWQDFLCSILIPVILALLTMWQTKYFHDLDVLNSERQRIEDAEYQERLIKIQTEQLEIEQEILTHLEAISDSLEEFQEDQKFHEVPLSSPGSPPIDSLNPEEPADIVNGTFDVPGTHNGNDIAD